MNEPITSRLSERYLGALRTYFQSPLGAYSQAACVLGVEAAALGLETLDLARIHEEALKALFPHDGSTAEREERANHGAPFFTEVIRPIELTHVSAREAANDLHDLNVKLDQRTQDLADSRRDVQLQISDRKNAEATLKLSTLSAVDLLQESHRLEEHLHVITRDILAANESERKRMSLQLQDEIAQALLGIHVRLLALKKEAAASRANLAQEISITQELVEQSAQNIQRYALEIGIVHEN